MSSLVLPLPPTAELALPVHNIFTFGYVCTYRTSYLLPGISLLWCFVPMHTLFLLGLVLNCHKKLLPIWMLLGCIRLGCPYCPCTTGPANGQDSPFQLVIFFSFFVFVSHASGEQDDPQRLPSFPPQHLIVLRHGLQCCQCRFSRRGVLPRGQCLPACGIPQPPPPPLVPWGMGKGCTGRPGVGGRPTTAPLKEFLSRIPPKKNSFGADDHCSG